MEEMGNESALHVTIDDMARMVSNDWEDMKKTNEWEFEDEDTEDCFKTMFIYGYYNAWVDISKLTSGLDELDDLIKNL